MIRTPENTAKLFAELTDANQKLIRMGRGGITQEGCRRYTAEAIDLLDHKGTSALDALLREHIARQLAETTNDLRAALHEEAAK